jgi:L-iditol 2-dehydrogenase
MMKNTAAVMTGLREMELREIPVPTVAPGEVLVKIEYVGICGSDLHYYEQGRIGDFVVEGDFILGHECAGTVVGISDDVTTLKVGDRVALEPGKTCGKCEYCKTGRYNLCPYVEFLATPPYDGCLMNYIAFPAELSFKLPDGVSTKEGALIEPLAVGLEAASVSSVSIGDSVAILGSGCIGLCTMLACKARGASMVIMVDVIERRLEKAKELGADVVINAAREDVEARIAELTGGAGTDKVIETAGNVKTAQQTIDLVKRGGEILIVGMGAEDNFPFNFGKFMSKVASIKTIFRYKNQFPVALAAVSSGQIDIKKIVTNEFSFEDSAEAFERSIEDKANIVKAVIKINE